MSNELRMWAYYYGFEETGVPEIDKILSAVACAGKAHHHTELWDGPCGPIPVHSGDTAVDWIQNAANEAAEAWNTRPASVPVEALDLVRFLAETWVVLDEFVRANIPAEAMGQYPVIQGTRNQLDLMRVAKQSYNPKAIYTAVRWMIDEAERQEGGDV